VNKNPVRFQKRRQVYGVLPAPTRFGFHADRRKTIMAISDALPYMAIEMAEFDMTHSEE